MYWGIGSPCTAFLCADAPRSTRWTRWVQSGTPAASPRYEPQHLLAHRLRWPTAHRRVHDALEHRADRRALLLRDRVGARSPAGDPALTRPGLRVLGADQRAGA